jgi:hypothetical protein
METLASSVGERPEHRRAVRHRTFLGATIVHGDAMLTMACSVRDWSDVGARIEVPLLPVLPGKFWLLDRRSPVAMECRLVWRRENLIGVEFTDRKDLEGATEYRLAILRGIWKENAPRAWKIS